MKKLVVATMSILMVLIVNTSNARDTRTMARNAKKGSTIESKMKRKEIRKTERNMVPVMDMDAFQTDFGNVPDVSWEKDQSFFVASFKKNGKKMQAYYDDMSKLVGTTTPETFADLPMYAQKNIKKYYKNYTVDKVTFFKDNTANDQNMLLYGVQFEDADNYFVELTNKTDNKSIVVQVNPQGQVFFFKDLNAKV